MKKILSLIMCCILIAVSVIGFSACSREGVADDSPTEPEIAGGWTVSNSPEITDELKKVFEKAKSEYTGMDFIPVAFLSSQVVAGINYCFLCKATTVVPDGKTTYALIYIYEDLEGNAEITEVKNSEVEIIDEPLDGGWTQSDSPALTKDAKKTLENASQTLTGAQFEPFALLATQTAAGTNYRILCIETATVPDANSNWAIVTAGTNIDGSSEIAEINNFDK